MARSTLLNRSSETPILGPASGGLGGVSAFNPGVICIEDKMHMLYRAADSLERYVSRLGYAVSDDGFTFERVVDHPVAEPMHEWDQGGVEDPRITPDPDQEGAYLVTYAAPNRVPGPGYADCDFFRRVLEDPYIGRPGGDVMGPSYTGLLRTRDFQQFEPLGFITPQGIDDRDGILFSEKVGGRYVMLHRPTAWVEGDYRTPRPSIWLAFSEDLKTWDYGQNDQYLLMTPNPAHDWEAQKIGGSAPPIRTDAGWFMFYHGVDTQHVYRVGAALLDLADPRKVLARTDHFWAEPELEWEKVGVIPNVVFPTANVLHDGQLKVYYGAADKYIGCWTANLDDLVNELLGG